MYRFLSDSGGASAGGRGPNSGRRPVGCGNVWSETNSGPGGVLGADGLDASPAGSNGGSGSVLGVGGLDASPAASNGGLGGVLGADGVYASPESPSSLGNRAVLDALDGADVGEIAVNRALGVVGAFDGAGFGKAGVDRGAAVLGALDGAGFGEGLCGPRILGLGFGFAGMIVGTGGPLEVGGWPASAAVSGNGGAVGTLDGASDGVVRANDDSGPSAGVEVARSNDDLGPFGRGIFFGRAGSALQARPGGRSGLPKGRMAEWENAGTVAICPKLKPSMLRSYDVY